MASAGRVLLIPKGGWESGSDYFRLDVVYDAGSSYVAKADIVNSTIRPVNDAGNWQILAQGYGGEEGAYNTLKRAKRYSVGDVVYSTSAPLWAQLVCVTAGTTALSEPAGYANASEGDSITDGTAVFLVCNARMDRILSALNKDLVTSQYKDISLGNQFTTEQAEMIAEGDFKRLVNGGYWDVDGRKVRIVDNTNWYARRGDQGNGFTAPHLVIMCDENILKADGSSTRYMKDTNDTTGAYASTKYRATYRAQCKRFFTDFFGAGHIASYRGLIATAVANGRASSWSWSDCDVELPTENMVFGSPYWGNGAGNGYNGGSFYGQLALFRLAPQFIVAQTALGEREHYWEQDVVSASNFANVGYYGHASHYAASGTGLGLRPFALLI